MKRNVVYLDRATGKDSGYAFGTLWREITNGISAVWNGIVGLAHERHVTDRLYITEETEREKNILDTIDSTNSNTNAIVTYIVILLIFMAVFFGIYMSKNKKG